MTNAGNGTCLSLNDKAPHIILSNTAKCVYETVLVSMIYLVARHKSAWCLRTVSFGKPSCLIGRSFRVDPAGKSPYDLLPFPSFLLEVFQNGSIACYKSPPCVYGVRVASLTDPGISPVEVLLMKRFSMGCVPRTIHDLVCMTIGSLACKQSVFVD